MPYPPVLHRPVHAVTLAAAVVLAACSGSGSGEPATVGRVDLSGYWMFADSTTSLNSADFCEIHDRPVAFYPELAPDSTFVAVEERGGYMTCVKDGSRQPVQNLDDVPRRVYLVFLSSDGQVAITDMNGLSTYYTGAMQTANSMRGVRIENHDGRHGKWSMAR